MKIKYWLIGMTAMLATANVQATPKPNPELGQSLQEASFKGFDSVKIAQQARLSDFKSVYVAEPELNFADYWLRKNRFDVTKSDEQRIRRDYTRLLKQELEKSLTSHTQLQLVDTPNADTLVITPQLERFRLTAPDLRGALTKNFVDYVGSAELVLRLSKGPEGQVLAELADHRQTRTFGGIGDLKPTNRAVNRHDFKWLFRQWGKRTSEFLSEAQSPA